METGRGVGGGARAKRHVLWRRASVTQRRASRLDPVLRALIWATAAGVIFSLLNTLMRGLVFQLTPFQTQFLRYVFGLLVMLPLVARAGWRAYMPQSIRGQFVRGIVHTLGLCMWFTAIPHITLADTTAIGFTGPIFIMLGAAWFFGEKMRWERWLASLIGFTGVLIVVAPKLAAAGGGYSLLMLASAPVFAASFLITKGLTRYERPEVIVLWQSITIMLLSLPLAIPGWQWPTAWQWAAFLLCGLLGSTGHYCLTRSFSVADISATQSVKFLDLVWASLLGWIVFSDTPSQSTLIGGAVICASTIWIARRETRGAAR
ncbi:DMT family transporter [Caenimonas aquaedulcis]|uniref:DMT family transporter n=1 Tax=Caenimonas aquaedulcis TaxID=2793270 RepID=A0A931MI24_9BURK|nr:DMT family transporter [Caenimonas aquaedulcis]MBG9389389.1 DMT family transporter [Caenimonas aquaedulcis]